MPLNNSEYQVIMREYDELRLANLREQKRRKERVYAALPVLAEIDEQLIHGSVQSAKLALRGDPELLLSLKRTNDRLIAQKKDLIRCAGFSENYLEPIYRCPLCKDTGYAENGFCRCFRQAVINHFFMDPGRRELLEKENFSTFDESLYSRTMIDEDTGSTYYELMKDFLQKAKEYVEHFDTEKRNLLIRGETGVGKTFLTNCIAKALLDKNYTVLYLSSFRLFEIFERYKFGHEDDSANARRAFDTILDCDLLIIDDLGTELTNSYTNSQLFICMEERALRHKPIVISTNLSMEKIKRRYAERVVSRLFNFQYIKILGSDNRIKRSMM